MLLPDVGILEYRLFLLGFMKFRILDNRRFWFFLGLYRWLLFVLFHVVKFRSRLFGPQLVESPKDKALPAAPAHGLVDDKIGGSDGFLALFAHDGLFFRFHL